MKEIFESWNFKINVIIEYQISEFNELYYIP
jgi:hypothetical protein